MNSMSMQTVLPARVIGQLRNKPMGLEAWPSHAQRVIVDGASSGDPSCFQTTVDIRQVDAPSSIMHRETLAFWILTGIWKAIEARGGGCSDQSTSNKINILSEGSTTPLVYSRPFHCEGHDWRSSSVEMAAGDCAKSLTMLYEWVALREAAFRRSGPLGILV